MLDQIATLDGYLTTYGAVLAERTEEALVPLHKPKRDPVHPVIDTLLRAPFEAQAHVITGVSKHLDRAKSAILVGEMGTGKTFMGMASVHANANGKPYRALVFCPGHLVNKWQREIEDTIPNAIVHRINHWTDLIGLSRRQPKHGAEWWIIPRDRAKLGAKWRPAELEVLAAKPRFEDYERARCYHSDKPAMRCPKCGQVQVDYKLKTAIEPDHFLGSEKKDGKRSPTKRTCRAPRKDELGQVMKDAMGEPLVCGEQLWQETSELRRVAPADYIHRRLRRFFDYLIVDEVHEEKGADTAQGNALGRLAASAKKVIALTGTLIGGKADHLRPLLFRLFPKTIVAEGHEWSRPMPFSEQYGRIETKVVTKGKGDDYDNGPSNRQSRGRQTSGRTTKTIKPGILPTIFGRHLINNSVFLLLDEVAHALPELVEDVVPVEMDQALKDAYTTIADAFATELRSNMFNKGGSKILGPMLSTLLCYPDHPYGWDAVGWTGDEGFIEICKPENLDPDRISPKEQALIDWVKREWYLGRQVWVFCQFNGKRNVQGRLARLLKENGLRVGELSSSVPLEKREEWIAMNGPKFDVILSYPKLVETGLDFFDKMLTYNFSSIAFFETGYNLFTVRQAGRRAWRIGQRHRCKIAYFYWKGTMEESAMSLMGRKMAAAQAIDGRFSTEGLSAMAEDEAIEMQLAKALADALPEDAAREWSKIGEQEEEDEDTPDVIPFQERTEDDAFYDDLERWLNEEAG
jgi:hypothetical protein